jgi:hypothetical protein
MRVRLAFLSALIAPLLIAGCGAAPKIAPKPTPSAGQVPAQIGPGSVMTEALTEAHCVDDGKGTWAANGVLKNTTKEARAFDVRIYIGPPDGQRRPAHVVHTGKIPADKSAPWSVPAVASESPAGPCHIQVRVAK